MSTRTASHRVHRSALLSNPLVQSLEQRRMLSASLNDGVLLVEGTSGNDRLVVSIDQDDDGTINVSINGQTTSFDLDDVARIRCEGKAGDDRVVVSESNGRIGRPTRLEGGRGRDFLRGGSSKDLVLGGPSDDSIRAGAGDDRVEGGKGDDDLLGERGADDLSGGLGHDELEGGRGRDHIRGGDGRDTYHKGDGDGEFDDRSDDDNDDELIPVEQLPAAVVAAFNELYSNATIRKVEVELEDEDGQETVVEYEIKFVRDDVLGEAKFLADGTFVEGDMSLAELPSAVQTAFETEFPGATVREVEVEEEDEGTVYKVEFETGGGEEGKAEFAEDGELLDSEIEGEEDEDDDEDDDLTVDQLPQAVRDALTQAFGGRAVIQEIEVDSEDIGDVYEIEVRTPDGDEQQVVFDGEGNWLE